MVQQNTFTDSLWQHVGVLHNVALLHGLPLPEHYIIQPTEPDPIWAIPGLESIQSQQNILIQSLKKLGYNSLKILMLIN